MSVVPYQGSEMSFYINHKIKLLLLSPMKYTLNYTFFPFAYGPAIVSLSEKILKTCIYLEKRGTVYSVTCKQMFCI